MADLEIIAPEHPRCSEGTRAPAGRYCRNPVAKAPTPAGRCLSPPALDRVPQNIPRTRAPRGHVGVCGCVRLRWTHLCGESTSKTRQGARPIIFLSRVRVGGVRMCADRKVTPAWPIHLGNGKRRDPIYTSPALRARALPFTDCAEVYGFFAAVDGSRMALTDPRRARPHDPAAQFAGNSFRCQGGATAGH